MYIKRFIDIEFKVLKQPYIEPISDRLYKLVGNYTANFIGYHDPDKESVVGDWFTICVRDGFIVDGQSAPKISWPLGFRPDGIQRAACLIHDALYRSSGNKDMSDANVRVYTGCEQVELSRKASDQLYFAAYQHVAPDDRKPYIGYMMLRLFGRRHFGGPVPSER